MSTIDNIRNFAIITHIDHGKSTLADRLIQFCGALADREMKDQILDSMDIERERGITIKAQTVRLIYKAKDGDEYILNIIDTPGHVDFSYEVNRSLSACESSLLVVDASQGVEAQTLANLYQAVENDHVIIPVLNKIDLPAADPDRVKEQIETILGINTDNVLEISAKSGIGIEDVLECVVKNFNPPETSHMEDTLKAMLVDSWYDSYLGVVILVRVINGSIKKGMEIKFHAADSNHIVERVGYFSPKMVQSDEIKAGELGYITAAIKEVAQTKVGDTIILSKDKKTQPLAGFKPSQPVVFCGLFPSNAAEFKFLRDALGKLKLNDSSFHFEQETSAALGMGFRCGFLGLLHLEIITERLEREFDINLITTTPGVIYKVHKTKGEVLNLQNPSNMPDPSQIEKIEEPWIKSTIITPVSYTHLTLPKKRIV